MSTYCKVTVSGNTTSTPRLRNVRGELIATVSLAVNTTYTLGESFLEETSYIDIIFYAAFARAVKDLTKGTKLYVEGRGRTNTWKDKESGRIRLRFEVVAEKVKRLPNPSDLTPNPSTPTNA